MTGDRATELRASALDPMVNASIVVFICCARLRAAVSTPSDAEVSVLADLVERHRRVFTQDVESAKTIISIGASPQPQGVDPIELAAWTSAARTVLNLHETYSRN